MAKSSTTHGPPGDGAIIRPEGGPRTPASLGWRSIGLYVGLALAVSWILQILAIRVWGLESPVTSAIFVVIMWSPTLLALAFIVFNRAARTGVVWKIGRLRYLPLGILVPTVIAFLILAIMVSAGMATSGWFVLEGGGVTITGGPWVLGEGFQGWPLYVLNIAATAVTFSIFSLVATTGEEFAWRGFLQGHLVRRTGVIPGILILAAIWWAWHVPGLLAGYNFPDYPILGALVLFPLQMIGASLFFGWLTIRAGSFWPAALAHAAVNSIQQGMIDNLQLGVPVLYVDVLRTTLILAVGLVCWAMLRHDPT